MHSNDVIKLFAEESARLDKMQSRQSDTISQLATLIAEAGDQLSTGHVAVLIRIGAIMYKNNLRHNQARSEVATTMRESLEGGQAQA